MRLLSLSRFAVLGIALLIGGCASQPTQSPYVGFFAPLKTCHARYAEMDAKVAAADAQHAAYYRVPGYPYLRTNRLLASFAHEVDDLDEIGGWVRRMRELDQEAREYEFINLGLPPREVATLRQEFLGCGRGLASIELADDPEALAALRDTAQPPDEYSTLARAVGLYPVTAPLMKQHVAARHEDIAAYYQQPVTLQNLHVWKAKVSDEAPEIPDDLRDTLPDELGFPGLTVSGWTALAEMNAPDLLTHRNGKMSGPGKPVWRDGQVEVDLTQPSVHYFIDFVRFGGEPLVRINYFYWFAGAPTPENGAAPGIDSFIWRVTLDPLKQPLVYESLHASGRDHQVFPAQRLVRRKGAVGFWKQSPLMPLDARAPADPAVRISADEPLVTGLTEAEAHDGASTYVLRPYEDLYLAPTGDGEKMRSIFNADGFLIGAETDSPLLLRASGTHRPGVVRQYGLQATRLVGRQHADDPYLLDALFLPPDRMGQTLAKRRTP